MPRASCAGGGAGDAVVSERTVDGKLERAYASGRVDVVFRNGTVKARYPDGAEVVQFVNGDVKTVRARVPGVGCTWLRVDCHAWRGVRGLWLNGSVPLQFA
jgi:hypothetical protein